MNFVKLYIGDYQRDTGHLSIVEHGAYLLMLQHAYATEKPLPTGRALHRLLRAESKADRDAIDSVVRQFWAESAAGLVNARADEEIRKADHQRTVNREVGKKGGNPYLKEQYDEPGTLYAARLPDGRIKVGITAGPWSKRAYGLAKVYGGRPEPLALVEVEHMGRAEAEVLAEFAQFADGEVLTLPDDKEANLLATLLAKGVAKTTEVRHPNREAITSPSQTPDTRHQTPDKNKEQRARGTRLQLSALPEDWRAFCAAERADLLADVVFDRFADYWRAQPGQRGVRVDWLATWRNWVRNERAPVARGAVAPVSKQAALEARNAEHAREFARRIMEQAQNAAATDGQ